MADRLLRITLRAKDRAAGGLASLSTADGSSTTATAAAAADMDDDDDWHLVDGGDATVAASEVHITIAKVSLVT